MFREIRNHERISERDRNLEDVDRRREMLRDMVADTLVGSEAFSNAMREFELFEERHPELR